MNKCMTEMISLLSEGCLKRGNCVDYENDELQNRVYVKLGPFFLSSFNSCIYNWTIFIFS